MPDEAQSPPPAGMAPEPEEKKPPVGKALGPVKSERGTGVADVWLAQAHDGGAADDRWEAVRIRQARLEDAPALGHAHVQVWRTTYRGVVPDSLLDEMCPDARGKMWVEILRTGPVGTHVLVAEHGTEGVVGFLSAGPGNGPEDRYRDEVHAINILPGHQRRGIGRRLLLSCFEQIRARGADAAFLWTLKENTSSRGFFERIGGKAIARGTDRAYGLNLPRLLYAWDGLSGFVRPARKVILAAGRDAHYRVADTGVDRP